MKKYLLFGLVSFFIITVCGAPPESEQGEQSAEDVSYQLLNTVELQNFIEAFPVFKKEAEKISMEWEEVDSPEHFSSWFKQLSKANKDMAGLDAQLRAAGMPWDEFWPAFAKTMVTFSAIMYDSAMAEMKTELEGQEEEVAELEAKLKDPNISAQEKEMIKTSLEMMKSMQQSLKETEEMYAKVPQENKGLIKKHWQELTALFEED